jgi:hypothetical protein
MAALALRALSQRFLPSGSGTRDELVAQPALGADHLRIAAIILNLLTEMQDASPDRVDISATFQTPYVAKQRPVTHQPSFVSNQLNQHVIFMGAQANLLPGEEYLVSRESNRHIPFDKPSTVFLEAKSVSATQERIYLS